MWLLIAALVMLVILGRKTGNPPEPGIAVSLIAHAIARAEGFFGGDTLPYRRNNPGSITRDGELIQYDSVEEGWNALRIQIESMLSGLSSYYDPNWTILEIARVYTGNDKPDAWARIVSSDLGVSIGSKWNELPQLLG